MDPEPLKLNIPPKEKVVCSIIEDESLSKRTRDNPSQFGTIEPGESLTKSQLSSSNFIEKPKNFKPDKLLEIDTSHGSIIDIIKKSDRTDEEAWILYQYLKDYKFFNLFTSMTNEVYQKEHLIHIFKRLKYEECAAGQVIFEEGESSNGKMYIVLSGKLIVMTKRIDTLAQTNMDATQRVYRSFRTSKRLLNEDTVILDPDKVLKRTDSLKNIHDSVNETPNSHRRSSRKSIARVSPNSLGLRRTSSNYSRKSQQDIDSEEHHTTPALSTFSKSKKGGMYEKSDISYYGYVRDTIEKGGYFGERALETNSKRSASIIAEANCQFFVLTKEDFLLIKKTFYNKVRDLFNFVIDNMPGLNHIQRPLISENYVYLFEERVLNFKNHLFHEGESGDFFYLIYSGTCEIYRTVSIEEQSTLPISFSKVKTFFAKSKRIKEKIPLAIINEGSLVGEEILQMENPHYSYSVQVTSDSCKVLAMNKNRFRFKFSKDTIEHINSMYLEKKFHKDQTLMEQLEKRDLEIEDSSIDTLFLKAKRNAIQNLEVEENPKINKNQIQYNSYKRITPQETLEPRSSLLNLKENRSKKENSMSGDFSSKVRASMYLKSNIQSNLIDSDQAALEFLEENRFFELEGNKDNGRRNLTKKLESLTNSKLPAIDRRGSKKQSVFSPTSKSSLFKNRSMSKFESDLSPLSFNDRRRKKQIEIISGKALYFTGSEINSPQAKDYSPIVSHQIDFKRINTLSDEEARDNDEINELNNPKDYFLPFPGNLKTEESSPMQSDSMDNSYGSTPIRSIMKSFQSNPSHISPWSQKGIINQSSPNKRRIMVSPQPLIITKSPIFYYTKERRERGNNISPSDLNDKSFQFRSQYKPKKKKILNPSNSMQKEKLKKLVENMQNATKKNNNNKTTQNVNKEISLPLITSSKNKKLTSKKGSESWFKMNQGVLKNVSLEECFFSGLKY